MLEFILIVLGFIFLIYGSQFLITSSESIAKKFKIPELIIGLTLVSFGTSIPEFFISIQASISNEPDIIIGNVIGSNITNLLLILGASSIFKNIYFKKNTKNIEIPFMLFLVLSFSFIANINNEISRIDSLFLITILFMFIIYIIKIPSTKSTYKNSEITSLPKTIIFIILGITLLAYGSRLVVDNANELATLLNIENSVISLTLVALGTSLPEIVTYVVASIKKENDMALGNIIGSNIFNILIVLGICGMIEPISYNTTYNTQLIILFVSTLLLLIFAHFGKKNTMTKYNGIIYIIIFIVYLLLLI